MLTELHIENYALIDETTISFTDGLNVMTGETGAGKSLVLDCLGLVLGGKASTDVIRTGCEYALIEAVFEISDIEPIAEILSNYGLFDDGETQLILSREINIAGKSKARIDGRLVPLQALSEIGECLVNIYGQHEHQLLTRPSRHIYLLDAFAGEKLNDILLEFKKIFSAWSANGDLLFKLSQDKDKSFSRLELLKFQVDEIDSIMLEPGEDEKLESERKILSNFDKIEKAMSASYACLSDGIDENQTSVSSLLKETSSSMKQLRGIDLQIDEMCESVEAIASDLDDLSRKIRNYLEDMDPSYAHRLNEVADRLNDLSIVKKKYGGTLDAVLSYKEEAIQEIEKSDYSDENLSKLSKLYEEQSRTLVKLASSLREARLEAARKLCLEIEREMTDLSMNEAKFDVKIDDISGKTLVSGEFGEISVNNLGMDSVEFLLSANQGEPLKPLAKIASGGELSRIMLAMKCALVSSDIVSTMVFDEIDSGVGGRTATSVAIKLKNISKNRQCIVVTHLAQIACRADNHIVVSKSSLNGRTLAQVTKLGYDDKVEEIARMASGANLTDASYENARQMLLDGQNS